MCTYIYIYAFNFYLVLISGWREVRHAKPLHISDINTTLVCHLEIIEKPSALWQMDMYPIKINTLESKIHIHAFFLFPASLHICPLTHEEECGSMCRSILWKMVGLCIHTDTCVYIFFIEACLYDSSVTGPSVHTLHDIACLSALLK